MSNGYDDRSIKSNYFLNYHLVKMKIDGFLVFKKYQSQLLQVTLLSFFITLFNAFVFCFYMW